MRAINIIAAVALIVHQVDAAQYSTIDDNLAYHKTNIKTTQHTSTGKWCDDCDKFTGSTVYVINVLAQVPVIQKGELITVQKNIQLPGRIVGVSTEVDTTASAADTTRRYMKSSK
ncbi:unnamed protein product [Aphanomyces euteiches]